MFLFLLVLIMICWLLEKKNNDHAFHIAWTALTAVLCLRFAQGIDYREYWMMYNYGDVHSEFLWRYGTKVLHDAGIPFEVFIFCISLFMMYAVRRAIVRFSPYKCFSLLLLYPTIYFNYFFSVLRTGFLIAFFLGFMLEWLIKKKYKRYIIIALLLMGVHYMAALLLPLVFLNRIKENILICIAAVSMVIGFYMIFTDGHLLKLFHIERLNYYLGDAQVGIAAFLEKIFIVGVVWFLYHSIKRDAESELMYKVCLYGLCVAMLFLGFQMVSGRFFHLLTALHIVAIPFMIKKMHYIRNRKLVKVVFFLYAVVILSKNMDYYLAVMNLEQYNIASCPYITILNKEKTVDIWGKDSNFAYINGGF